MPLIDPVPAPTAPEQSSPSRGGAIIAGLGGGVAGLLGSLVSNAQNRKLAEYSYSKNLEQWNRSNLYNSPSQQMARLKQAGLNPNLVYGNGAVGNSSGGSPQMQTPSYELDTTKVTPDLMQTLGAYQSIELQKAQTDNVKASTQNQMQDVANKAITNEILRSEADVKGINLNILKETQPYQADKIKADSERSQHEAKIAFERIGQINWNAKQAEQEFEASKSRASSAMQKALMDKYERQWMEKGITRADALPVRVLANTLESLGVSLDQATKQIQTYILNLPIFRD